MEQTFKCVDLFAGCGGMSLGFEAAGFELLAAYEQWKPAIAVYRNNFSHPVVDQDLSDVQSSIASIAAYRPQVIIGGPPCQDFSTAGAQDETRGRAALSVAYSQIVSAIQPKYFVMENVATIRNSRAFTDTISTFRAAGYGLTQQVLDAAYCGVPQSRKRMFVIGELHGSDNFLDRDLEDSLATKPLTMHEYFGDSLGIEHYFRVPTNYNRRGVFSIYEPATTIRGVDRPIPKGYKGHPKDSAPVSEVRGLTPKERSLVQTFPDSFEFSGGKSDMNSMIGNAVPVNLAKFVGNALRNYIERSKK